MKIWYNSIVDSDRRVVEVQGDRIRIGRAPDNDLVLNSPYIGEEAAVLHKHGADWNLVALGLNGIKVGDRHLYSGDRFPVTTNQSIGLFPFSLSLDLPRAEAASQEACRAARDQELSALIREIHLQLLSEMDLSIGADATDGCSDEYLLLLERNLDAITQACKAFREQNGLISHIAGHGARDRLLAGLCIVASESTDNGLCTDRHWSRMVTAVPERESELQSTAQFLKQSLELDQQKDLTSKIDRVERHFWPNWDSIGRDIHEDFKRYAALRYLKKEIKDIVFGYGPLEDLLRLPTISEIMVVDRDHIYIERNGVLENSGRRFISDAVIQAIIERIVSKVGRRIDKSRPLVDARLSDGSRVNAVIPPLAVSGPCLTIRKFPDRNLLIEDLIAKQSLTRTAAEFLRAMVLHRCNIIVSGGTGTGKTTLLNCLSDFIPNNERIVTVEDTAELQLNKEHVVRLETKDANIEGTGEYTIRDLVRNALRMRPDRIVVGECRGAEALDMLQAMNTGHDGSLTTIHANNSRDVILRLEVLVQMAADLPVASIRQQIASAVDVIIQLKRLRGGRRCVSQITEIVACNPRTGEIEMRDLFLLDDVNAQGIQIQPTGRLPTFMGELIASKTLDLESFYR